MTKNGNQILSADQSLFIADDNQPPVIQLNQTGDDNTQIAHVESFNQIINIQLQPQLSVSNVNSQHNIQQQLSSDYYQLLVTFDKKAFDNNVLSFQPDRVLEKDYVPLEIFDRCHSLDKAGIDELKTFPAIICVENSGLGGKLEAPQTAKFGYIKAIQKIHGKVKVAFESIDSFDQSLLCDKYNAVLFDLDMDNLATTLNRTAWSVHRVNIFDAFREAGIEIKAI